MSRHQTDDELMGTLANALMALDPPPPRLREAALRAPQWDEGLATLIPLVYDSAAEPMVLRDGTPSVRDCSFSLGQVTIDVSIEHTPAAGATIMGLIHPQNPYRVEVVWPDGASGPLDVDHRGQFEFTTSQPMVAVAVQVTDQSPIHRTELFLARI